MMETLEMVQERQAVEARAQERANLPSTDPGFFDVTSALIAVPVIVFLVALTHFTMVDGIAAGLGILFGWAAIRALSISGHYLQHPGLSARRIQIKDSIILAAAIVLILAACGAGVVPQVLIGGCAALPYYIQNRNLS